MGTCCSSELKPDPRATPVFRYVRSSVAAAGVTVPAGANACILPQPRFSAPRENIHNDYLFNDTGFNKLGAGAFSDVFYGVDRESRAEVAIKRTRIHDLSAADVEGLSQVCGATGAGVCARRFSRARVLQEIDILNEVRRCCMDCCPALAGLTVVFVADSPPSHRGTVCLLRGRALLLLGDGAAAWWRVTGGAISPRHVQ